jgi:hypothetical protein
MLTVNQSLTFMAILSFGVLTAARAKAADASHPKPAIKITTRIQGDNRDIIRLLPDSNITPVVRVSVKVSVQSSPETVTAQMDVEGVDRDGFQVVRIAMPELFVEQGNAADTTRWAELKTTSYSRIAVWRIASCELIKNPDQIELVQVWPKVVPDGNMQTLSLRARLVNRTKNSIPSLIAIQGLDDLGFGVVTETLSESSAAKWEVRANELTVECRGLSTYNLERVKQWRALPCSSIVALREVIETH